MYKVKKWKKEKKKKRREIKRYITKGKEKEVHTNLKKIRFNKFFFVFNFFILTCLDTIFSRPLNAPEQTKRMFVVSTLTFITVTYTNINKYHQYRRIRIQFEP